MVVGDEAALVGVGGVDRPVAPDRGGRGEQALSDAGEHAMRGAGPVVLQAELALEGVEHRLDPLSDAPEAAMPARFVVRRAGRRSCPKRCWAACRLVCWTAPMTAQECCRGPGPGRGSTPGPSSAPSS